MGISGVWDSRSSSFSARRSSSLSANSSGLFEWSLVFPSSPSDTEKFSELKVEYDWQLLIQRWGLEPKNQRNSVTGTTTFFAVSVDLSAGGRSPNFFSALQGNSNSDRLKLFNFKATEREISMFMWLNAKADGYHWPRKKSAFLIILCIPVHGMEMFT